MTNKEQVLQVIEFFKGKKLVFKNHSTTKAVIRATYTYSDSDNIRVILAMSNGCHWNISIRERDKSIDWLLFSDAENSTNNWDLTLNGISFKKCIKEGLGCLTLYDIVQ